MSMGAEPTPGAESKTVAGVLGGRAIILITAWNEPG